MDRQYIRDAQIIERYLLGTLSAAEEQAFEEAYLADAELLDELEVAERLREGVRDLHGAGPAAPQQRRSGWLATVASPRFGIAASVVAAAALVSAGALYLQNRVLQSSGPTPLTAATHTRLLPLVSVRGADNANVLVAPPPDEWIVLLLDAGFADYDRYRAMLVRRDRNAEQELLRLDGMTPTYEGLLAVGVPGRMLAVGEYEIRLQAGRADWPIGRDLDELSRTSLRVTPRP
jgi:hypothetical protein